MCTPLLNWRPAPCAALKSSLEYPFDDQTYAVVIEQAGAGFSPYVPDLPGCVAAASTREAVLAEIRAAIQFHLEGLASDGFVAPASSSSVEMVSM